MSQPRSPSDARAAFVMLERERFRRRFAARALLIMLDNGGVRSEKVRAAVEYADLLLAQLDRKEALS